jgi:cytochrome c553
MIRRLALVALLALSGPAVYAAGNAEAGKRKSAPCQQCHGPEGNSASPFPRLAGQYADYLAQALRSYKNGDRKNPIMAPFAMTLSERDMWDLAEYFASQTDGLTTRPRVDLSPAQERSELPGQP